MEFNFLSDSVAQAISGCTEFEDVQDDFLILIYILRNYINSNIPQYKYQILSC